jgi:glycosyltransferase involved in cell wall biosynthesis
VPREELSMNRHQITTNSGMSKIHAIILTFNEEKHLARCIESLGDQVDTITVVDCGSTDATIEIAKRMNVDVIFNPWVNHATQMNFAIEHLASRGGWLLRIDADEILDQDSGVSLREAVRRADSKYDGILVQRRIYFLGRRLKHGSIEPSWHLRLWRNGRGRCEQRWMDEHIVADGMVIKSNLVISDVNLNSLTWWTAKHNDYASRESIDALNARHSFFHLHDRQPFKSLSAQAAFRRFVKEKIYYNAPPGVRPLLYFLYRYFLRLGFLDGIEGFYFHLLQGFWYRSLVDAKIVEIRKCVANGNIRFIDAVKDCTGIALKDISE